MLFFRSRPRVQLLALTSTLALLGACSSSVDLTPGQGGDAGSGAGAGATAGAGSGGSGGSGGVFEPGGEVTTHEVSAGIGVLPGEEKVVCTTVQLQNPEGGFVRRFRALINQGSHHMIVYRSKSTTEQKEPVPCESFSGLLSADHPIFIAQSPDAELVFPTDDGTPVGLEIGPYQMLRIELHAINPTSEPLDVVGTAIIDTIPLDSAVINSDLAFWGTVQINIPPQSSMSTPVKFQPASSGTKSFALTTHQHKLGTRMRVWHTDTAETSTEPVADSTSWSDPPLEIFDPPLEFPADKGGQKSSKGFAYQCEWNNPTPNTVKFGESASEEMCFLWHYYYPALGFQLCIDGGGC